MDARCQERAEVIAQWIDELERAEETFMNLEASEDAVWSDVFLEQKEGSVEERKAKTNADARVRELRKSIAVAKRVVSKTKRMYDLALKAGDWEYGTIKYTEDQIRRQRGA